MQDKKRSQICLNLNTALKLYAINNMAVDEQKIF